MKVHHTLICFFLSALQDSETGLVDADETVWTGTEGGSITVVCKFPFSGWKSLFCKKECEKGNVLIETESNRKESDRYTIQYEERTLSLYTVVIYLTIKQLTKSDSGSYACGLERSVFELSLQKIKIIVTEASTTLKPNRFVQPSSTSIPAASTPTTQSSSSSVGSSTPSSADNETTKQPETSPAGSGYTLPLVVCLIVIVLLAVSILTLYRWKRRGCSDLNCRTSTSRDMEFMPHDNCAPASTLGDPSYENVDSPAYETLNHHNRTDQIYCTLE